MRGTDSANTVVPDIAGTAAALHAVTDAAIAALNNLSQAEAKAACDAAFATYSPSVAGDNMGVTSAGVAAILAGVVEGSYTLQDAQRILLSVLSGISTGGGTTNLRFRDMADTKNRISATMDANDNRTSVTRDVT